MRGSARSSSTYLQDKKFGWLYWAVNPNAGDTEGLLENDWNTPRYDKLELLSAFKALACLRSVTALAGSNCCARVPRASDLRSSFDNHLVPTNDGHCITHKKSPNDDGQSPSSIRPCHALLWQRTKVAIDVLEGATHLVAHSILRRSHNCKMARASWLYPSTHSPIVVTQHFNLSMNRCVHATSAISITNYTLHAARWLVARGKRHAPTVLISMELTTKSS